MAFPEPQCIPSLARLCDGVCVSVGVCLCGTAEVIISSGRRDFLVPVVVPRGAVPVRDSQLVPATHPPSAIP